MSVEENNKPSSEPRLLLVRAVVEIVSCAVTDAVKVQALVAIAEICGSAQTVNVNLYGGSNAAHTVNLGRS